jgi:hypothetical protein
MSWTEGTRPHVGPQADEVLEDVLAVRGEVADLVAVHADPFVGDAEHLHGRGQLVLEDVLREAVGDRLLADREGGVEDLVPLAQVARDRASGAELAIVDVRREDEDPLAVRFRHDSSGNGRMGRG